MSEYNIQMNKYNALNVEYDQLYPATKIENVDGLNTALQNKAPGGYGYGENISFESWDDTDGSKFEAYLDNLDDGSPKIIRMQYISDYPALLVSGNSGYADVHFTGYGEILVNWHGYQSVLSGDDNGTSYLAVKKRTRGEGWSPWEYVNPPMLLGVEYRTTERYLGKPVYVKAVNFGALPNNNMASVTFGDATTQAFSVTARVLKDKDRVSYTLPVLDQAIVWAGGAVVYIKTTVDYSDWTGVVTVKYTKTTD